jgi:hypothetical protein
MTVVYIDKQYLSYRYSSSAVSKFDMPNACFRVAGPQGFEADEYLQAENIPPPRKLSATRGG